MTMLTQYLNAERRDPNEPLSFYEPGAIDDPDLALARRRGRRTPLDHPVPDESDWDGLGE